MKKALKIIGISLLIILTILLTVPFVFQSQIKEMVKTFINDNVNAKVEFSDVNLSFLRRFPHASVTLSNLVITNYEPFEGENLARIKFLSLEMSVTELFKKSDDPITVDAITINEATLHLITNSSGDTNFDIVEKDEHDSIEVSSDKTAFNFNIEDYSVKNSAFTYIDQTSGVTIHFTDFNHSGKGSFSGDTSELDTNTNTNVTLSVGSSNYLSNVNMKLDALIGMDFKTNTYTFKDNKALINQLPLEFQGYLKQLENGQEIDIAFENPESSFKDFLAIIPEQYSKNLDNVNTSGDFKVNGSIKGLMTDTTIPKLDINIFSNNASFKYPDLPKRVENININASIKNKTGNTNDTYIDIKALNFKIDEDVFKSSGTIKNLTKNMLINAKVDGTLNLGNITKTYPIELTNELGGTLKGKINASFDMNALRTNAFNRIKINGSLSIRDFIFSSKDFVHPIHISMADISFRKKTILLNNFRAKTGQSDLSVTGNIKNLLGFLLSINNLQGYFNVNSNTFYVSDFMMKDASAPENNNRTSNKESLKIPAFLDCTINANANTVYYDNLKLEDVKGLMIIKDEQVTLKNMTSSLFEGELVISGNVSTKKEVPVFNMALGIDGFNVSQSFKYLELFQSLAPIAQALQGKLNTTLNLKGTLDKEFTPNLNSITGDALAEILTSTTNPINGDMFNKLSGALNFIDFKKLNLKDLRTKLAFENGKVTVKPFTLKYDDIDIEVSGSHGFDKSLSYAAVFNVPAKYLGNDVNKLIGKINDQAVNDLKVPVTTKITGTYASPSVSTDLTSSVSNLTKQLIEIEKQKLLNQGKGMVTDLMGDVFNKKSNKTSKIDSTEVGDKQIDSTAKKSVEKGVKDILSGLFNKKKKKKDSTQN